jgi:hypothetical protein
MSQPFNVRDGSVQNRERRLILVVVRATRTKIASAMPEEAC